jgi:hypothetical protein
MSIIEQKSSLDGGNGGMVNPSSFQVQQSPGAKVIKLFSFVTDDEAQ